MSTTLQAGEERWLPTDREIEGNTQGAQAHACAPPFFMPIDERRLL